MIMMQQPKVLYYAKFEYDKKNRFKPDGTEKKTPTYVMIKCSGCYPPMAHFINKRGDNKGKATMYLMQKRDEQPNNAPKMYLQSTGSLNFANSTSKCKITKCFCKSTPLVLRNSISFLVSH